MLNPWADVLRPPGELDPLRFRLLALFGAKQARGGGVVPEQIGEFRRKPPALVPQQEVAKSAIEKDAQNLARFHGGGNMQRRFLRLPVLVVGRESFLDIGADGRRVAALDSLEEFPA